MPQVSRKITIIGGAAVDIISRSNSLVAGSNNSHVGKIFVHEGGTTRNAAECLGHLGLGDQTTFISGIGDDDKSSLIENSLSRAGVSIDGLCKKVGERTAAFSGFINSNGDFLCGVADMDIL